ncbi:AbrB family transcriptional regulator [Companilactobacillus furfuricola]|uniref:AbrB family transcriptional regulator n=1 Tax=Companilactobacillus furfuricola TaxID=1462575 RepID=UPI000F799C3C|nr:AbrB family transcriptional regulator [Companilactobacillus furfuricola]
MNDPEELKQIVKMFKNGSSYGFRISKKDRELLNADVNNYFEKIVSPDGKKITFKKIEKERPNVLKSAKGLFEKHSDLMKRLEDS